MQMPGRSFSSGSYRYGFNGKESDDEVSGSGNQYDYGFRIYNPRIGKFLSVDPLTGSYPWYTPYQFAGNMPIWAVDIDGLEPDPAIIPGKGEAIIEALNSDKVKSSFSKSWDHFRKSIGVETDFKGPKAGFGLDVDVGPVHIAAELYLSSITAELIGKNLMVDFEILPYSIEGGIGGLKAGVGGNVAETEASLNIESGEFDPGEAKVLESPTTTIEKGEFNINTSGKIGFGVKLFGLKVKPWINVGHLYKGIGYAIQGIGEAIGSFFGSLFSKGERINESFEVGPLSEGRIKE
jgi:RHS repeat-associated protein